MERDMGVWVGVSSVPAVAMECVKHSTASQLREVIVPLYAVLGQPHLESCLKFWTP